MKTLEDLKKIREKAVEQKTGAAEGGAERLTNPGAPLSPK